MQPLCVTLTISRVLQADISPTKNYTRFLNLSWPQKFNGINIWTENNPKVSFEWRGIILDWETFQKTVSNIPYVTSLMFNMTKNPFLSRMFPKKTRHFPSADQIRRTSFTGIKLGRHNLKYWALEQPHLTIVSISHTPRNGCSTVYLEIYSGYTNLMLLNHDVMLCLSGLFLPHHYAICISEYER